MTIWYDAATNSWTGGTQRGEALANAGVSVSSFSGSKTGNKYEVGKSYSMGSNGDTYRANADGTFTNNRTGGSLAGSSSADGVSFYGTVKPVQASASSGGGSSAGGKGPGNPNPRPAAPGKAGAGPGVPQAAIGPKPSGGSGAGSTITLTPPGMGPYRPGFEPGGSHWNTPIQFTLAPKIDGIKNMPLERTGIGGPQEAPGAISDIGWVHGANGEFFVVPSADAKTRIEDDIFAQGMWQARNVILPGLGIMPQPRPDFIDPDRAQFNFWTGGWSVKDEAAPPPKPRLDRASEASGAWRSGMR